MVHKHFVEVMTDPLWLICFLGIFLLFLVAFSHKSIFTHPLGEPSVCGRDKHLRNLCYICIYLTKAAFCCMYGMLLLMRFAAPEMDSFILVNGKKVHMVCL